MGHFQHIKTAVERIDLKKECRSLSDTQRVLKNAMSFAYAEYARRGERAPIGGQIQLITAVPHGRATVAVVEPIDTTPS
jgi:hypothetical protein